MSIYYVRGFTAATAATADHAIAQLWNPSGTKRIRALEIGIFKAGAGAANDSLYLCRTTTIGTVGSTVTPDADNSAEGDVAPDSGATLGLAAYTVQPTKATPALYGWVAPVVAGAGIIIPLARPIVIPPGTGLCLAQRVATAWPVSEVTYVFED